MFVVKGRNKKVILGSHMANLLMQNHMGFHKVLLDLPQFDDTECSNEDILSFMKDRYMNSIQEVRVKRHWNPWSAMIASFHPKYPLRITLNAWKIRKRTADSIAGTIMHEFVHLVDNFYENASFGHGNNSNVGKENTAPYKIGSEARLHCIKHID